MSLLKLSGAGSKGDMAENEEELLKCFIQNSIIQSTLP
jgi:hypothetical protein